MEMRLYKEGDKSPIKSFTTDDSQILSKKRKEWIESVKRLEGNFYIEIYPIKSHFIYKDFFFEQQIKQLKKEKSI